MTSKTTIPDRPWTPLFLAILLLAVVLRMTGIGQWSFASDELGTFKDVQEFRGWETYAQDDPDRNLPRMIPLAMGLHVIGHSLFGTDEAGSRLLPAVFGILQILVVGLGLRSVLGKSVALAAVLLLALAPEHIFYCQYHRFYTPAAFFASTIMLAAAQSIKQNSKRWTSLAVTLALLGIFVHTLLGMVLGGLLCSFALIVACDRTRRNVLQLIIVAVGVALAVAVAGLYLLPMAKEKAVDYVWAGYSTKRAILSGIVQVSWPVLLLAVPGFFLLWRRNRDQGIFWGTQVAVWVGAIFLLPRLIPFHSGYVFPLCLPIYVCAGVGLAAVVESVSVHTGRLVAAMMLGVLVLVDLPVLVSYYQDGSRHDFRAAANWLGDRVGPDDLILAVQGDKLSYYRPELAGRWQRPPNKEVELWLESRRPANGRVWYFLPGGRSGMPEPWREWAERTGRLQATIVHRRFDYHEYPIFILQEQPPAP